MYKLNEPNELHSNGDGYITKDGHTMLQQDIVRELNTFRSEASLLRELNASLIRLSDEMQQEGEFLDNPDDEPSDRAVGKELKECAKRLRTLLKIRNVISEEIVNESN